MARKQSKASGGSMWFGMLLGVIFGLAAAVAVALFVTKAPVPFMDKASRASVQAPLKNVREAPDPNLALGGGAGQVTRTPSSPLPARPPSNAPRDTLAQDIDQLIAGLSQSAPAVSRNSNTASRPSANTDAAGSVSNTQTLYYLQAGAFRSQNDAEALKARVIMLGLNGFVQPVQREGVTLHRVRVGPFRGIDEMNRSRITLGKNNISSAVVRP